MAHELVGTWRSKKHFAKAAINAAGGERRHRKAPTLGEKHPD
jgi:hypothetical protein